MKNKYNEKTYKILGCPIHYWISDNISEQGLIFLHGAGFDHKIFLRQIDSISNNYKILFLDLRGHGKSRPIGEDFSLDILVNDVIHIMNKENFKSPVFVGHSLGGNIAQEIAFRYPKRVMNLILIGSTINTKKLTLCEKVMDALKPNFIKLYPWEVLIKQDSYISSLKPKVRKYAKSSFRNIGKKDYIKITVEAGKVFHYEKGYKINKPILFCYGEKDIILNKRKTVEYWCNKEEKCEFHIIKDAAHNANEDNPTEVNRLILNFLKKNSL